MKTLEQFESELTEAVTTVTLMGQLGYDERDLEALRGALRPLFDASVPLGLRRAGARYPLTFALYLVLEGVYGYNGGDYWSGPYKALDISGNYTRDTGELFRNALREKGLPTFESLGGHVNLAPILAHGGIPDYCLDDFFDLLDREARRETGIDVPSLMEEWASEGFRVNIDRPAQRFLLHGGDVAEEFVERCLALWREDEDPESLDLPARVLDRYERWRAARPEHGNGRRDIRLGRPRLIYDPYGEGVAIVLPPVVYRANRAPAAVTWRVAAGDRLREEKTFRRLLGDEIEYAPRAEVVNVLTIAPAYAVTVLADDTPLHDWKLPGPGAPPLLAFDRATGELLPDRQRENDVEYWLSPGERVLVFPRGWASKPAGARKLAELPDPGGEWGAFAFETWRVEPDARIDLSAPAGSRVAFRARNDPPPAQPCLDGAPLIAPGIAGRFALYNGRPPLLRIPPGRSEHKPEKWRIEIVPAGTADPPAPRAFSLADLPRHCVMLDGDVLLSLDAPELLGPSPLGEFHIHLRGPYGRRANFDIRFVPGLRFEGYPRLHLAADDAPTRLRISHPADLELTAGDPGVALGPPEPADSGVGRALSADAGLTAVPLVLRGQRGAVAFELPVYRLRFGLVEPERPDAFQWATSPLRLHPEALDAAHTALLRADLPLPPGAPSPRVTWQLAAPDGRVLRQSPPRPWTRHPETGLAEWLDTFRSEGRMAALQLVVVGGDTGQETAVDVARLLPTLELGQVATAWHIGPDGDRLSVVWETDTPARNRQLRLWPLDRPWSDNPEILRVPDDAAGCAEWNLPPGRLSPGDYLAELVVADPWHPGDPPRPALDAPNVFPLRPDEVEAALEAARDRARHDELTTEDALAWVGFLTRARAGEAIARFNITLWRGRNGLSIEQLLFWANAARTAGDETAYRITQKALFEETRIAELGGRPAEWCSDYLAHLSDGLDAAVYRALLPVATGEPRRLCLRELCRIGDEAGYTALLGDVERAAIGIDAAVEMLRPAARAAADFLHAHGGRTASDLLLGLLRRVHDDRFIAKGSELQTNAGHVRVTGVRDARTLAPLDVCRNNGEPFLVVGKLWPATSNLPVQINLAARAINIMKGPIYRCKFSGEPRCDYVFGSADELGRHHRQKHRMIERPPSGAKQLTLDLTQLSVLPPDGF